MEQQPNPELTLPIVPRLLTPEQRAAKVEQLKLDDPYADIPKESRKDPSSKIVLLEKGLFNLEQNFPLEKLHSIVEISPKLYELFADDMTMSPEEIDATLETLSPEEQKMYRIRAAAKDGLRQIGPLFSTLRDETTIDPKEFEKLRAKYRILSRAVGILNSGRIDHDR